MEALLYAAARALISKAGSVETLSFLVSGSYLLKKKKKRGGY
jgi:hypothetical protein